MVGDQRQGWAVFAVMGMLVPGGVLVVYWSEDRRQSGFRQPGVDSAAMAQAGGNMEGKEVRFGIAGSARCSPPRRRTPRAAR